MIGLCKIIFIMESKVKKAIVTGPTGAIGLALVKMLIKNGYEVYAICRPSSSRNKNIIKNKAVHIIECDLSNINDLYKIINIKCDCFFHLAWEGTLNPENRFNMYLQNKNVGFCLNAVDVAKKLGCSVFVGVGSQAEYGIKNCILKADTATDPISGYGMAKLCAGNMTRYMCNQYGMKHIWVRVLSVYGIGDGPQTLISSAIQNMLEGKRFSMTFGEQVWDYLYSEDSANALIALAEKGINNRIYVLGSGYGRTLRSYIETIRNIINPRLEIGFGERNYNKDQVMFLQADISELVRDTDWLPVVSFEDGIRKIIQYKEPL